MFDFFHNFENFQTKDEQDQYLQGLIDVVAVKRRRKSTKEKLNDGEDPKRDFSFNYHVMFGNQREKVCQQAFISIFALSCKKIRRLRDLKVNNEIAKDKRGRHTSNTLPDDLKHKICEHISSFPVNISHYSGKEVKYLASELNYRKMFNLFKNKNPEITKTCYTTYWQYFKQEFPDLRFGQPQIDTCCTCESLNVKIKSPHLNDAAKRVAVAEMMVHKRKAKKYYACIKKEVEDKQNNVNENVLAITMDYMMNVPLPKIPVQELFYLRQLTGYVFCIQNIKQNKSTIFIYHEGQAKRGPDEVCSFLKQYIDSVPMTYDEVHVYADNCGGQNKNHAVSRFFLALTDTGRFKKVKQFFPVVGHSYSPCDRDFAIIKRSLRKCNRLYTIRELTELIVKSSVDRKFIVVEVNEKMILDFQSWWGKYYKRSPISQETKRKPKQQQTSFGISSYYHFEYDTAAKGVCKAMSCINGLVVNTFCLANSTRTPIQLPQDLLYTDIGVSMNPAKLEDIQKTLDYIPDEHKDYYLDIISKSIVASYIYNNV